MIDQDSENSASGGPRYPIVAGRPHVPTNNTEKKLDLGTTTSPIVVGAWSHLRLGLVQIDILIKMILKVFYCLIYKEKQICEIPTNSFLILTFWTLIVNLK